MARKEATETGLPFDTGEGELAYFCLLPEWPGLVRLDPLEPRSTCQKPFSTYPLCQLKFSVTEVP